MAALFDFLEISGRTAREGVAGPASGVASVVNADLRQKGQPGHSFSASASSALLRLADGDPVLLTSLGGLAVFLARLESADQVEASHIEAAALSRSEVDLRDGRSPAGTVDVGAKLVASQPFGTASLHGRIYVALAAVAITCALIVTPAAVSAFWGKAPPSNGPSAAASAETSPLASVAIQPPRSPALVNAPPPMASPPPPSQASVPPAIPASPPVALRAEAPAQASVPDLPKAEPDSRLVAVNGAIPSSGDVGPTSRPSLHVIVTFAPGDTAGRERASRLARYLRGGGYDVADAMPAAAGRHSGHVDYFFSADAAAAAKLAAFLGGKFGGEALMTDRLDQRRPGTIEIALQPTRAAPAFKAATATGDTSASWHVGTY